MRTQTARDTVRTRKNKMQARRKRKRKKVFLRSFVVLLVMMITITGLEIYKLLTVLNAFDAVSLATVDAPDNTLGILMLGLDRDGGLDVDAGHTDSITYIGANVKTKKAVALPIYRDMNIPVVCADSTENINRIYAQNGIECFAQSVSSFLDLPIHHYVVITLDGFIDIINALDTISITPEETFCSRYGVDKKVSHCFTAEEEQTISADEAMAYVRYRGGGNGERRANRQVEIIQAVKNRCLENALDCYNKVSGQLAKALKTNFPPNQILQLLTLFGAGFDLETLDVIHGRNVELSAGDWTTYVNEDDKLDKTAIIREQIFTVDEIE